MRAKRLILGFSIASCACGEGSHAVALVHDSAPRVDTSSFSRDFEVLDSLVLQESPDVTTIFPIMTLEEDGGILVSEHREDQVRVYSSTGALLAVLGRGMENGSSIHRPYQADRLPNGSIAVTSVAPSRLHVVSAS